MNKSEAQSSILKLNTENNKLNPSVKIIFYEIDLTDLALDLSIITNGEVNSNPDSNIIRLHNNFKLFSKNLIWQGKTYHVAPIQEEGFEVNSTGTAPTPKLSISVEDDSGAEPVLAKIKTKIRDLNGLIGAKLTRKSTFVKYLDSENFIEIEPPEDFDPDPNAHFPDDVFYFDRKSKESKNIIEYEFSSLLDLKSAKLPNRIVSATKCPFQYRGAGCLYEYKSRRVTSQHGNILESTLPEVAVSVANDKNERIMDILKNQTGFTSTTTITDRGQWQKNVTYSLADQVYIPKNGIKYYFVCKKSNTNISPPNQTYWITDSCAKDPTGCGLRWRLKGTGFLRTGAFVSASRIA